MIIMQIVANLRIDVEEFAELLARGLETLHMRKRGLGWCSKIGKEVSANWLLRFGNDLSLSGFSGFIGSSLHFYL